MTRCHHKKMCLTYIGVTSLFFFGAGYYNWLLHSRVILHNNAVMAHLVRIYKGLIQVLFHIYVFIKNEDKCITVVCTSPHYCSGNYRHMFNGLVQVTVRWHLSLISCICKDHAVTTKDGYISVWFQFNPTMVCCINVVNRTVLWEVSCFPHLAPNTGNYLLDITSLHDSFPSRIMPP